MSDITLVTPPDKLHLTDKSFLLIHPSSAIKEQFQHLISTYDIPFVVYLYEPSEENEDPEWLFDVFHQVDYVILDIDNCSSKIRALSSYFISKNKTYWLTNGGENYYNIISKNRIFDLDFLTQKIGDDLEKQEK